MCVSYHCQLGNYQEKAQERQTKAIREPKRMVEPILNYIEELSHVQVPIENTSRSTGITILVSTRMEKV